MNKKGMAWRYIVTGIVTFLVVFFAFPSVANPMWKAVKPLFGQILPDDEDKSPADVYTQKEFFNDLVKNYRTCGMFDAEPCYCDLLTMDSMMADRIRFTPSTITMTTNEGEKLSGSVSTFKNEFNARWDIRCNINPVDITSMDIVKKEDTLMVELDFKGFWRDALSYNDFDIDSMLLVSRGEERILFQLSNDWFTKDCSSINDFDIENPLTKKEGPIKKCTSSAEQYKDQITAFENFVEQYKECIALSGKEKKLCLPLISIDLPKGLKITYNKQTRKFSLGASVTAWGMTVESPVESSEEMMTLGNTPAFCKLDSSWEPLPEADFTFNNGFVYFMLMLDGRVCVYQGDVPADLKDTVEQQVKGTEEKDTLPTPGDIELELPPLGPDILEGGS